MYNLYTFAVKTLFSSFNIFKTDKPTTFPSIGGTALPICSIKIIVQM